jgi:hypothetical protein
MKQLLCALLFIFTFQLNAETSIVKHSVTYHKKGSRSESRTGILTINNYPLPTVFDYVQCEGTVYKNHIRKTRFGTHGYFPVDERLEIDVDSTMISEKNLNNGFYISQKKLSGTPKDWIYVQWGNNSAFIAPSEIENVMSMKPFTTLKLNIYSSNLNTISN